MAAPTSGPAENISMKHQLSNSDVVASFQISANFVIIGFDNGAINIFSQSEGKIVHVVQHDRAVWALDVCDDTSTLVAGIAGGELSVWDLVTGTKSRSLSGHTDTVRCVKRLSSTRVLSASRDCTLRIWDVVTGTCESVLEGHTKTVRDIAVYGDRAVSVSYDQEARVWDVSDGREKCLHVLRGHGKQLYAVDFMGRKAVTGGLDADIRVWDVESGENLAVLKGHTNLVGHLIIVSNKLISSSADGMLRIWSLNDFSEIRCIRAHESGITELVCDGTRILSGGADGNVKVWDFESGGLKRELVSGMDAVWKGGFVDNKAVAAYSTHGRVVMEVCDLLTS